MLQTFMQQLTALAAVVAVAILAYNGSVSGDAAAAILGGVAGVSIGGAVSERATAKANGASR